MNAQKVVFAAMMALLAVSVVLHSQGSRGSTVLYEGARIIVGTDVAAIENGAFVVQAGRITSIGPRGSVAVPTGASRVDLTGKTVMPALVNNHTHLGYERFTRPEGDSLLPTFPNNYTFENVVDHLQRYAYYGVGTVLDAGTAPHAIAMRMQVDQADGKLPIAARFLFAAGIAPPGGGADQWLIKGTEPLNVLYHAMRGPEGRAAIQEIARKKIRYVKLWLGDRNGDYPAMPYQVYEPVTEEAHKFGIKVHMHATTLRDQKLAVGAGADWIAHPLPTTEEVDDEFRALLREKRPYWTAMLVAGRSEICEPSQFLEEIQTDRLIAAIRAYAGVGGCQFSPSANVPGIQPRAIGDFDARQKKNFMDMVNAGARVVLGTDSGVFPSMGYGWYDHTQLKSFVTWGMTPAQAIIAATSRAAEALGLTDVGVLAAGKMADFIVLNADPIEDISNTRAIAAVYLNGVAVDRKALAEKWKSDATQN